jgi:3-oxosteroid 1-dehydrogenase
MTDRRLVVVGSGFAGLVAALTGHETGIDVVVIEKTDRLGGTAAYSGGQVWVPGNHLEPALGVQDDAAAAETYVRALTQHRPELLDVDLMREWLLAAPRVASWLEAIGAISWEVVPDFPDYHYPRLPGTRPLGRYLTPAPFRATDAARDRLLPAPHFPSGITYTELFAWGGQASRRSWDHQLLEARRRDGILTFGHALMGWLVRALTRRGVPLRTGAAASELLMADGIVTGVRVTTDRGARVEDGAVLLATGSYDWDADLVTRYSATPAEVAGSVAPPSVTGDAFRLAEPVGAAFDATTPESAARLPGLRLAPLFPGDSGERQCHEHGLPHAIVVNRAGRRFCDDAFPGDIAKVSLGERDADGGHPHLPFFMIWDDRHRRRYGLADVPPGGTYPAGTVSSAHDLGDLARQLGIDGGGLVETVRRYNAHATDGTDPEFDRGGRLWSQRFKGDAHHLPHPNIGPVQEPPFHGIALTLDMTGIPAAGLATTTRARVVDSGGRVLPGLYAAGSCTAMRSSGAGYNSGFSLSRAMTGGYLAAVDVSGRAPG